MDHRQTIIHHLEALRRRDFAGNDKWKVRAYDKVLKQLRAASTPITSMDDISGYTGIGEKIRKKIEEILETGDLQQTHDLAEEVEAVDNLSKVFGIGPIRARELFLQHGVKTVDELRLRQELLNDKQKIGIKYVDDFAKRIPRSEMDKHAEMIVSAIKGLDAKWKVEIMGSYRRGTKDSGDIDVLVTHEDDPSGANQAALLAGIVANLQQQKYLYDTLALGQKKYNGVCRLKRYKTYRRIDIMYSTKNEFPFALLYFTGSQEFNIELRARALDRGFTMNEHGIKSKTDKVDSTEFETEEDVFKFLGLRFVPPEQRAPNVMATYLL